jgi:hypothetical protein
VASAQQRTLDSLIKDVVDFVGVISETKDQAAAVRERLCGMWPQDPSTDADRPINGQLDALEQFQSHAWQALRGLRENLLAIQTSLG